MTGSTTGTAYSLHYEAVGAGNRNDADVEQHYNHSITGRIAVGLAQREHNKAQLIGRIKQAVADMVLATGDNSRLKNSEHLSHKLCHDYTYLANVFSEATGSTLEQYIIGFRIDRVKELLLAGQLSLAQIAYQLSYSSAAHLSNQFKKVAGLTPSSYKALHSNHGIMPESGNNVTVFCNCVNASEVRRVSFAT